jgi:hypothetical protein
MFMKSTTAELPRSLLWGGYQQSAQALCLWFIVADLRVKGSFTQAVLACVFYIIGGKIAKIARVNEF